jgi:1-deoxy-D-xylulose-5-phosphate reductoisomerase
MKQLTVLGATGSIGCNTIDIVEMFPDRFAVRALAAGRNVQRLAGQIRRFRPDMAVVIDQDAAQALKDHLKGTAAVDIRWGAEAYCEAAALDGVDMVVTAVVGAAGLLPTLAAIDAGKDIALANKETLVMAGELVMARAAQHGVKILPVDSEHSAIFQCLSGQRRQDVEKILLTASGGPFRQRPADSFADITPADALRHPNWKMGPKITIDSATMINKGLEVIEAKWLFDLSPEQIEVLVHPQSVVHSMVAYRDGSVLAQLGIPDMRGAIGYALAFPERLPLGLACPDFAQIGALTFQRPDLDRFPCLALALAACRRQATCPAVLNAANEVAVAAFLHGKLSFPGIARIIDTTLKKHTPVDTPTLSDILEADRWARAAAETEI